MKILSIYSFISTLFQPSKLKLNQFFPWLPPTYTTINLSSRVKILLCVTLSAFTTYKVKGIFCSYWNPPTSQPPPTTKPSSEQPPTPGPTHASTSEVNEPCSQQHTENKQEAPPPPLALEQESVDAEEVAKNLKYLNEVFSLKKIPEKHQKTIDNFLDKMVKEAKEINVPDFHCCLILMSTFDAIRKDPSFKKDNPHLLEILKNTLLSEFSLAIKRFFYKSTSIQILKNQAKLFIVQGKKATPSTYSNDEQAQLAQQQYDVADTLSPPHLISLCLYYIKNQSFEKAAYLYVLGITRIEQDWAIYSKYPNVFKKDLVTKYKNDVFALTDQLKHQDRKDWDKALKTAKKKELPCFCHYDFRWPIFSMLMDQAMKTTGNDQPLALEGESLFKMCDRGMIYQSFCLQDFAADPRFQMLD